MSKYLSDMPSYYRSSIYRMLQKFGLQGCVQNFEKGDGLNRKVCIAHESKMNVVDVVYFFLCIYICG